MPAFVEYGHLFGSLKVSISGGYKTISLRPSFWFISRFSAMLKLQINIPHSGVEPEAPRL